MKKKALLAEFIGTFLFVFVGMSSIGSVGTVLGAALAHGLAYAALVSATAAVSGGHLNPAVTISMILTRKMCPVFGTSYVLVQLAGAATAGALAFYIQPGLSNIANVVPALGSDVTTAQAILAEAGLTFALMLVILTTVVDKRAPKLGGLYAGLIVTIGFFAVGGISGAAFNPARWFGAALVTGDFQNTIIYIVGPLIGAILAGIAYSAIFEEKEAPLGATTT